MRQYPEKWKQKNAKLVREFSFIDFKSALNFVNRVGEVAESQSHHPDIQLFSYNKVHLTCYTHDSDSVTIQDYALAEEINSLC